MQLLLKLLILYLIYKVVSILLRKGVMYYRAYRNIQQRRKRQEAAMRRGDDYDLRKFDIEDAKFEEIPPGQDK